MFYHGQIRDWNLNLAKRQQKAAKSTAKRKLRKKS